MVVRTGVVLRAAAAVLAVGVAAALGVAVAEPGRDLVAGALEEGALAGAVGDWPVVVAIGLVWLAHIGFDRVLGYGLKYPEGFKETHLQRV